MSKLFNAVFCAVLYGSLVRAVPLNHNTSSLTTTFVASSASGTILNLTTGTEGSPTTTIAEASPSPTVPYASDDPNYWLWNETIPGDPEPVRGKLGASILGPQNVPLDRQNPDLLAPPTTDNGNV